MPYCRFKHGKMLQTKGKLSKRDGGLRQYYHCRCSGCSYTTLEFIAKHEHVNKERHMHNTHDQPYPELYGYKKVNDHYMQEINLVRMGNDINLVKDSKGNLTFIAEVQTWEKEDAEAVTRAETLITYRKDGTILINFPSDRGHRYGRKRVDDSMLTFLPNEIGMYETNQNDKRYLLYDIGSDVRRNSYSPTAVWDITKSKSVELMPDGEVKGAKKIVRGEKKFAENKPLQEQLNEKHYREMTKARLDSDLELDYTVMYATFRGCQTDTKHYAIEMYKPSKFGQDGPNSGLIRRLFTGRFMQGSMDEQKCKVLALEIIKDIPDSCLSNKFANIRAQDVV